MVYLFIYFLFFEGASICVENLLWYLQELVEVTHYVEFLFLFYIGSCWFPVSYMNSLVWTNCLCIYCGLFVWERFCIYVPQKCNVFSSVNVRDEKELLDNCCPMHLKLCVPWKEDNYLFALSKYKKLLDETLIRSKIFAAFVLVKWGEIVGHFVKT